jgi:hypothetical protein
MHLPFANTGSSIQAESRPGHMVLAERSFEAVADHYPGASGVELQLTGESELVAARILDGPTGMAPAQPVLLPPR